MTRLLLEPLETRRLLSANVAESEPNNARATADVVARHPGALVQVTGRVGGLGDRDWFEVELRAGDVVGAVVASTSALDTHVRLVDAAGRTLIANDDSNRRGEVALPAESPLPYARADYDAEVYRVVERPGTYYVEVAASAVVGPANSVGGYRMDLMVARPGMEAEAVGARQVLFLDFDGARVDYAGFASAPHDGRVKLSPLADLLPGFRLSAADEDALVDKVVARVTTFLSADIEAGGLNGDYGRTGRPGDFDLEIRNSRDHRDTFGRDPLVSRVVIGGTAAEAGFVGDEWGEVAGVAQDLDPGNFKTDDEAVATLDWITAGVGVVSAAPPLTQVDLIAEGIAVIVAHEAGHIFGAFHTDIPADDYYGGRPNLMDPSVTTFIGPDLVLGSADDLEARFGVDDYDATDLYAGVNDTLNTLAFGLSTGTGLAAPLGDDDDDDEAAGTASAAPRRRAAGHP